MSWPKRHLWIDGEPECACGYKTWWEGTADVKYLTCKHCKKAAQDLPAATKRFRIRQKRKQKKNAKKSLAKLFEDNFDVLSKSDILEIWNKTVTEKIMDE